MNKSVKSVICLLLSGMTIFSLASCKKKTGNDTETRPVVFATETLDGNFNPFFSTSAGDSTMAGITQLGMLTTDANGDIICGVNEPTVALDYKVTEVGEGEEKKTEYEFVIKNGIKFSDGVEMTIKDVLFNMYVYLDPSYMGSSTMYSTDIVGLKDYRAQEVDTLITDSELNNKFYGTAMTRWKNIVDYLDTGTADDDDNYDKDDETVVNGIKADIATMLDMFREEVESDWTMNAGSLESYKDEFTFTEDWQIYYYAEGYISIWVQQGTPMKDVNGKYITNITAPESVQYKDLAGNVETYGGDHYEASITEEITAAMNDTSKTSVYTDKGVSLEDAKELVAKDFAIDTIYHGKADAPATQLQIMERWATGANILDKFVAEARTAYFEDIIEENDGKLVVPTIKGITVGKATSFDGVCKQTLNGEHYVLKVQINGVDPKAIYNFAFPVAPMHYYSGTFTNDKNITKDYVKLSKDELANEPDPKKWTEFGVAFNNSGFFEGVLQADEKNKKPVGAGAYQVSNQKGETTNVDGDDFYSNNWVYFARNDHFKSLGGNFENAKIKYLRYRVVNSDKLLQALEAKNIDVGEPNASGDNIQKIGKIGHLNYTLSDTNGYGYVGINPKFVPEYLVRKIIMSSLEARHCVTYYGENASILYRSMSQVSWVWKKTTKTISNKPYYPVMDKDDIKAELEGAGWTLGDDKVYVKGDQRLEYTFTIAGATTDHPAYSMFDSAKNFLNSCGFKITVVTDISALKKLATGQLAIWAAAWSSTADPDMYQVYHKDSKATSVNNWGYPTILNNTTKFSYENSIIEELSTKIEDARKTTNQVTRANLYIEALDLVMDLAVEMPTYQRKDCVAYNREVIDEKTINSNPTPFQSAIDKIWELNYV